MEVAKTAEATGSLDNRFLQTVQSTNRVTIPLYPTLTVLSQCIQPDSLAFRNLLKFCNLVSMS